MFSGKKILVGITAGIAAYKINFLIRLMVKAGAEVRVVLTPDASTFVSPVTLSTLSKNPVASKFIKNEDTGQWQNHVELGAWADLFLIAPLTANTLSKMAVGACDNLLLATYLSSKTQVMVSPAMDLDMYAHPSTQRNLETLTNDGVIIIPAESGELASGLHGQGRLPEPESIMEKVSDYFTKSNKLSGSKIMITAGPTYEAIDPVRFIGNRSSGKMGFELANAALNLGAEVFLITGPTNENLSHPNLHLIKVQSAKEMHHQAISLFPEMNCGIFAAAVADYSPKNVSENKIKKDDQNMAIELEKNPDILKDCGLNKKEHQLVVGFALETNDEEANALKKLKAKNADLIILNSLNDKGAGFSTKTNKVTLFSKENNPQVFQLMSKQKLAKELMNIFQDKLI
jgi:phosphopantothenoylcysteine decarboxylase / phosphopantothenate---cysteine ligase